MVENAIKFVIWGQEGVGKTTAASKFPNPWFIDTEKSTKWISELKDRQYHPAPKTWEQVVNQVKRFIEERPGETLVIDTADWMEAMLIKHLGHLKGWGTLGGTNDYGRSYNDLDYEFREFLNLLEEVNEMGIHVGFTAHMEIKTCTFPDQMGQFDRYQLKMQKKTSKAIMEWADCVLFLKFKDVIVAEDKKAKKLKATGGQLREFQSVRTATWDAKNRFDFPETMPFIDKQLPEPLKSLIYSGNEVEVSNDEQPAMKPKDEIEPIEQKQERAISEDWRKGVDPRLIDLMLSNCITEEMVRKAVGLKGFFGPNSEKMPINQYPKDFVEAMLIGKWDGFMKIIKDNGLDLPF